MLPDTDTIVLVRIAGLANASGQLSICWGRRPSYADDSYVLGLLSHILDDSGAGVDVLRTESTQGTFTIALDPLVGGLRLMAVARPRLAQIWTPITATDATIEVDAASAVSGVAANTVLYAGTETMLAGGVNDAVTPPQWTGVTRGFGGSTAVPLGRNVPVYDTPPALSGRLVEVLEVPASATSASQEVVVRRGYVAAEPTEVLASGLQISCAETFGKAKLNVGGPNFRPDGISVQRAPGGRYVFTAEDLLDLDTGLMRQAPPRFSAGVALWEIAGTDIVLVGYYRGTRYSQIEVWSGDVSRFDRDTAEGTTAFLAGHQLCYSDAGLGANPYRNEAGGRTENAVDIYMCHLTSTENGANGNWDCGTRLAPDMAIGWPIDRIDLVSVRRARNAVSGIRASRFWSAGQESESVADFERRLLSWLGITPVVDLRGILRLVKITDVFPGDEVYAATMPMDAAKWRPKIQSRALDQIVWETASRLGPKAKGADVKLDELVGRTNYPQGQGIRIGETVRIAKVPVDEWDLQAAHGPAALYVAHQVRLFANRWMVLEEVRLGIDDFLRGVQGDIIELSDPVLWSPAEGTRLASGDKVTVQVMHVRPEWAQHTQRCRVLVILTQRTGLIAPSARVLSSASLVISVAAREHSLTDDASTFRVGARVMLLDSTLKARSDDGSAQTLPVVTAAGSGQITIDTAFLDTGGSPLTPTLNDRIVLAPYAVAEPEERERYVFGGQGASPPADPIVGGDPAYRYGVR